MTIPHPGVPFDRINIVRYPRYTLWQQRNGDFTSGYDQAGDVFCYEFLINISPTTVNDHTFKEANVATFMPDMKRPPHKTPDQWPSTGWLHHSPPRLYGNHIKREYADGGIVADAPLDYQI